jgi:putative protein-disulfide isomerase
MQTATLYYIHDPMCSWCWGFRPTWQALQARLPEDLAVEYVLGGLAPDSDEPMSDEMRGYLQQTWRKIRDRLGVEFNFDFWEQCRPRRSTYPACRAVIAAAEQGAGKPMIEAVQRAYYTRAMNPSDEDTLITLAGELGLDEERFTAALRAGSTRKELERQVAFGQAIGDGGFPSLVLDVAGSRWPIAVNYTDADEMLAQIRMLLDSAEG